MSKHPVLFDYWRSSASYRVRIGLGLKEIAFDTVPVDLVTGEQRSEEHLRRNPQGLTPAIEIDGLLLTQSLSILEYLEETRPTPPLLSSDPAQRALARRAAHAIAMEIHPICNLRVAEAAAALAEGDDETRSALKADWMRRWISSGLAAVERLVQDGDFPFPFGPSPGLFECCLAPQLYNASRWNVDLEATPRLAAIGAACAEYKAFATAHPDSAKAAAL